MTRGSFRKTVSEKRFPKESFENDPTSFERQFPKGSATDFTPPRAPAGSPGPWGDFLRPRGARGVLISLFHMNIHVKSGLRRTRRSPGAAHDSDLAFRMVLPTLCTLQFFLLFLVFSLFFASFSCFFLNFFLLGAHGAPWDPMGGPWGPGFFRASSGGRAGLARKKSPPWAAPWGPK